MRRCFLLLLLASFHYLVLAQDGHYWTEKYGNKSMLLSGAVVGSVNDLAATYYNPSRLALNDELAFFLSAKVYQWYNLKVEDPFGSGNNFNQSALEGGPNMVGGSFKFDKESKHVFSLTFLTRANSNIDLYLRSQRTIGENSDDPLIGQIGWAKTLREEWLGGSWSYSPDKKFGVGLSLFYAIRGQNSGLNVQVNSLDDQGLASSVSNQRDIAYKTSSLVAKLGMSWQNERLSIGLTYTPPRVHLNGQGNFLYELYSNGIDWDDDGQLNDDIFVSNFQRGIKSQYRSPQSIAYGMSYKFGKGNRHELHISAEWFDNVSPYSILAPDPFEGQSTGDTYSAVLADELISVTNVGAGLEFQVFDRLTLYGGVSSDLSAQNNDVEDAYNDDLIAHGSIINSDLFHFSFGVEVSTSFVDLTLGALYNGSNENFERGASIPENPDDPIFSDDEYVELTYNSWRFVLGFNFPLAKK